MRNQEDLQKLFDGRESDLGGEMEDHPENCECDHCLVFKWNTGAAPLLNTAPTYVRPACEMSQEEAAYLNGPYCFPAIDA